MVLIIELVKVLGHWTDIPKYASISHGKKASKNPKALLKNLYNWGHMEPFEFVQFVWYLEIPIFLERQLLRHRISSKVEQSLRYVELNPSLEDVFMPYEQTSPKGMAVANAYRTSFETYTKLLKAGVSAEIARTVLPLGLMTKMYVTFNARSFDNFLRLRLDKHAQPEMQELAREMLEGLAERPESLELAKLYAEKYLKEG